MCAERNFKEAITLKLKSFSLPCSFFSDLLQAVDTNLQLASQPDIRSDQSVFVIVFLFLSKPLEKPSPLLANSSRWMSAVTDADVSQGSDFM